MMATPSRLTEEQAPGEQKGLQVVGLVIADEEYAIAILDVVGIERVENVLRLPKMPRFIAGVMPIRDELVPLVKLRRRFDLEDRPDDDQTRVIVIEIGDLTIGLVVDAVTSVYRLTAAAIQDAPPMALTVDSKFVRGVLQVSETKMLIYLDPYQIIRSEEADELARTKALARHYGELEQRER
jgi:purine-binding chemotaxis protein CheW